MTLQTIETINVGQETVIESYPDMTDKAVIFEDDGTTGYLYAIERLDNDKINILDAVHIYNVDNVTDKQRPSVIKILWTDDFTKSALLINDNYHAIIDFKNKEGLCRTGFPSPSKNWPSGQRKLTEEKISDFKNG
jgi:hypothetical protein